MATPHDPKCQGRFSERGIAQVPAEGFLDAHAILREGLGWFVTGRFFRQDSEVPDRILEFAKHSRSPVLLLAFLVASAALHAMVMFALPDAPLQRAPLPLTVLEVVLVEPLNVLFEAELPWKGPCDCASVSITDNTRKRSFMSLNKQLFS